MSSRYSGGRAGSSLTTVHKGRPVCRLGLLELQADPKERSEMGLFKRNRPEQPPERPPGTDQVAFAQQVRTQAMQWQAQARQLQAQAMQQAAAFQQASAAGSPTWVR